MWLRLYKIKYKKSGINKEHRETYGGFELAHIIPTENFQCLMSFSAAFQPIQDIPTLKAGVWQMSHSISLLKVMPVSPRSTIYCFYFLISIYNINNSTLRNKNDKSPELLVF